ncbi:hypothetical protein [Labrenzia sp. OB1]|uniref:hypothetical protein n=1 Tax=Labrenzia sp. OB1 TaxID=1561204 RepID=UPI0007B236AA|nr:hypothetical protein [Labrenzia sp. OB1]KZM47386.1 hypothetical protein OA90_26340 [Labrenzia sp. OB1]
MLEFAGYYWWTNYVFNLSNSGYWFNDQQWDPRLASVTPEGLRLRMAKSQLPNGPLQWSSVEVVLWGAIAGNPNNPGKPPTRHYATPGTYLVAATTPKSFDDLSVNCCFGAFTYQLDADPNIANPHRELDMVEVSRFGRRDDPTNAQFTLQPWEVPGNVMRFTIASDVNAITLVMRWSAGYPVIFDLYYGLYTLDTLPPTANHEVITAPDKTQFSPGAGCQSIHLNLWRQPPNQVYPVTDQEVTVTNFQFRPA